MTATDLVVDGGWERTAYPNLMRLLAGDAGG
jgi:hypothetical protein